MVHQLRRSIVIDFPQRGDDLMGAGVEKCPGKTDQSLPRIRRVCPRRDNWKWSQGERSVFV